jgi:2,3-bisphosphoglycerate-independent phosphoglycerate mutase
MPPLSNTPCVLIVRDGWGENPNPDHDAYNAIRLARTPVDDALREQWPRTLVATSGEAVGLLDGTMGNSEVGHQNIGAGRIVDQDAVRITKACREGKLREIEALTEPIKRARDAGKAVHLMGIASGAGVHGLITHATALVALCAQLHCERVYLHLFTDGRDTGPFTGLGYIGQIEQALHEIGVGEVASVVGRYWAMDRDNRWERVEKAYACLTGCGPSAKQVPVAETASDAVQTHYDEPASANMTGDEFVPATMIAESPEDACRSRITDGDTVIFYNYRGDRPREIVRAFVDPDFNENAPASPDTGEKGFDRGERINLNFVCMTPYSEELAAMPGVSVAFQRPPKMKNIAGEYISSLGLTQFRCAETEKFPHVTFFFNDYRDEPYPGEQRAIIQSPRVSTYDQQPEMSARGVADAVLRRLDAPDCEPFIVVNFANPDMVGHTGNLDAVVRAVETVDALVGEIIEKTLARAGSLIITADHGNAEQMYSPENESAHTAHTIYPVPLYVVGDAFASRTLRTGGVLGDIVPTMLEMMGLDQPAAMTGASLLT